MEKNKNTGIIIAAIIGISIIIGAILIANAWRESSQDITNKQLLEIQSKTDQQNIEIQKQKDAEAIVEQKKQDYLNCMTTGSKALTTRATTKDVELIITLCKNKTGYKP